MTDAKSGFHLFDHGPPRLFSIDAGRPFLDDLANGLIGALGVNPLDLSRAIVLLPTRRAVRRFGDSLLDALAKRGVSASLLPRLRAIGDIDEDELLAFAGDPQDEIDLPPAVSAAERLITLARLVAERDRAFAGHQNWSAAISAARELGRLLDSFYTEEIPVDRLHELAVEDQAGHWAQSISFLEIVTRAWPAHLVEIGRSDPAHRRAKLISAQADRWRVDPPRGPIVIAGTTASAPSTARLVDTVARAPMGAAVLPGLDRRLDEAAADVIDDPHPQAGLVLLLKALGCSPRDVAPWPGSGVGTPRASLLSLASRPAEATHDWLQLVTEMTTADPGLAKAIAGLALIEADDEEAEAAAIAVEFRQTVSRPGETALLVTPDRNLARRVALKMRRWKIEVDDSGGVPFGNTACGGFLRLAAQWLEDPGDPAALLALLRHPLTGLGLAPGPRRRAVDKLDRTLRGLRPPDGLDSVERLLRDEDRLDDTHAAALSVLRAAQEAFAYGQTTPFRSPLRGHANAAEMLCADNMQPGAERLWRGEDGEAGSLFMAEIEEAAAAIDGLADRCYGEIFTSLIAGVTIRRRRAAHPRLAILGPLEARLQQADHIILGGLNEGVWPADALTDPFLSRPMRKDLGLPSPERRIGLAAHDFTQLAAHKRATLTRSKRSGGAPAKPSRWLVRLKNILTGAGAGAAVDRSALFSTMARRLDESPTTAPVARPKIAAGPGRRPTVLPVTAIETWLRDPYAIYARRILGLEKLDAPGLPFSTREMGRLLHAVFHQAAAKDHACTVDELNAIFTELAPAFGFTEIEQGFWGTAIRASLDWFAAFDADQRLIGRPAILEGAGETTFADIDPPFTLTARADRIDLLANGAAAVIDYKSRKIPTENQNDSFCPQLSLTGLIVERGGFSDIGVRRIERYDFVKVLNRSPDGKGNGWGRAGAEAREAVADAEQRLRKLIAAYDDPSAAYQSQPRPEFLDQYGDYDQLARRKEWGASLDGDGGEA